MDREFSNWWEIPWIAYFVSLYKHPFDISEFSIYELEECLETDDPQSRLFFSTLLSELLRGLYQNPKIDPWNFDNSLHEICSVRLPAENSLFNPLADPTVSFFDLPVRLRIWLVYKLCCWRVEDEQSITDAIEIAEARPESLAEDRHGNLFWYFGGIHLFKQIKETGDWKTVARTKEEWRALRDKYANSTDKEEIWFRETIEQNFDPTLSGIEEETHTWARTRRNQRLKKLEKLKGKKRRARVTNKEPHPTLLPVDQIEILARGAGLITKLEKEQKAAEMNEEDFHHSSSKSDQSTSNSDSDSSSQSSTHSSVKKKKIQREKLVNSKLQNAAKRNSNNQVPNRRDTSSGSSSEEEEDQKERSGAESPGTWELLPGCSATRPQFVKVRPGQTLEEAVKFHKNPNAFPPLEKTKKRKRKKGQNGTNPSPAKKQARGRGRPKKANAGKKNNLPTKKKTVLVPSDVSSGSSEASESAGEGRNSPIRPDSRDSSSSSSSGSEEEEFSPVPQKPQVKKAKSTNLKAPKKKPAPKSNPPASQKNLTNWQKMQLVIDTIRAHPDSWPFYSPITDEIAPSYSSIIRRPMDIETIEEKIAARIYSTPREFVEDVCLMFDNCRLYNGEGNEYSESADDLEAIFNAQMKEVMPSVSLAKFRFSDESGNENRSSASSSSDEEEFDPAHSKSQKTASKSSKGAKGQKKGPKKIANSISKTKQVQSQAQRKTQNTSDTRKVGKLNIKIGQLNGQKVARSVGNSKTAQKKKRSSSFSRESSSSSESNDSSPERPASQNKQTKAQKEKLAIKETKKFQNTLKQKRPVDNSKPVSSSAKSKLKNPPKSANFVPPIRGRPNIKKKNAPAPAAIAKKPLPNPNHRNRPDNSASSSSSSSSSSSGSSSPSSSSSSSSDSEAEDAKTKARTSPMRMSNEIQSAKKTTKIAINTVNSEKNYDSDNNKMSDSSPSLLSTAKPTAVVQPQPARDSRESSESPMESATNWEQDYSKAKVNPVSRVLDAQDVQMVDSPTTMKRVAEVQDAILEMNEDFKNSPQVPDKSDEVSLSSSKSERKRSSDSSDKDYNLTSEQIERDSELYGNSSAKIELPKEELQTPLSSDSFKSKIPESSFVINQEQKKIAAETKPARSKSPVIERKKSTETHTPQNPSLKVSQSDKIAKESTPENTAKTAQHPLPIQPPKPLKEETAFSKSFAGQAQPRFGVPHPGLDAPTVVPSYLSGYTRVPSPKNNEAYAPAVSISASSSIAPSSTTIPSLSKSTIPSLPQPSPSTLPPAQPKPTRVISTATESSLLQSAATHEIVKSAAAAAESSLRNHLLAPHRAVSTFDYQSTANGTALNQALPDRRAQLSLPHFPINIPAPQNSATQKKESGAVPPTFPGHPALASGFQQRQERPFFPQLGVSPATGPVGSSLHSQNPLQDLQNLSSYPQLLHHHPHMINHAPQGVPNPGLIGLAGFHPPGLGPAAFGAAAAASTSRSSSNGTSLPHHPSMPLGMYSSQLGPYAQFSYPWPHHPNANPRR